MNLDHVFKKPNQHRRILNARKPEVPEGMLCRCNKCGKAIFAEEVRNGDYICPKCQGYFRLDAQERTSDGLQMKGLLKNGMQIWSEKIR